MNLYYGVVEDRIGDPLKMGRVKVRIFGLHSPDEADLPTEDLPWASVMTPTSSAAVNGIGGPVTGLVEGSWVVIVFADEDQQQPIILGSIPGNPVDETPRYIPTQTEETIYTCNYDTSAVPTDPNTQEDAPHTQELKQEEENQQQKFDSKPDPDAVINDFDEYFAGTDDTRILDKPIDYMGTPAVIAAAVAAIKVAKSTNDLVPKTPAAQIKIPTPLSIADIKAPNSNSMMVRNNQYKSIAKLSRSFVQYDNMSFPSVTLVDKVNAPAAPQKLPTGFHLITKLQPDIETIKNLLGVHSLAGDHPISDLEYDDGAGGGGGEPEPQFTVFPYKQWTYKWSGTTADETGELVDLNIEDSVTQYAVGFCIHPDILGQLKSPLAASFKTATASTQFGADVINAVLLEAIEFVQTKLLLMDSFSSKYPYLTSYNIFDGTDEMIYTDLFAVYLNADLYNALMAMVLRFGSLIRTHQIMNHGYMASNNIMNAILLGEFTEETKDIISNTYDPILGPSSNFTNDILNILEDNELPIQSLPPVRQLLFANKRQLSQDRNIKYTPIQGVNISYG